MFDAVLRVYGEQFEVSPYLEQHTELLISESYQQGELDIFGSPNAFSGFDVIVAENADAGECQQQLKAFLQQQQDMLSQLQQEGIHCALDIDVTISDGELSPESLSLPADLLATMAALSIAIEISAYPEIDINEF